MKNKKLLFYAPRLLDPYWVKNLVMQPLHALAENGWEVYLYTSNKDGAWDAINQDYLPHNPHTKIKFILQSGEFPVDISPRTYIPAQISAINQFLAGQLKDLAPDVIVVRGPSAPYLESLFPGVKIFNLAEGHFPFFNYGCEIALSRGEELYGFPFYNEHRKFLRERHALTADNAAKLDSLRELCKNKLYAAILEDYLAGLRKRFKKLILLSFDGYRKLFEFSTCHHTAAGSPVENAKLLLKNAPKDWCFLFTFHPHMMQADPLAPSNEEFTGPVDEVREYFKDVDNVVFPQFDLSDLSLTHSLVYYTDATAVETGKTFFLAMLLEKPLILLGRVAVDFYKPLVVDENLEKALESFAPPPREEMNHWLYWVSVFYKHPMPVVSGRYYYMKRLLERAADPEIPEEELYDWVTPLLQQQNFEAMVAHVNNSPKRLY